MSAVLNDAQQEEYHQYSISSKHLPRQDALPEGPGIDTQVQTQKVKDIAALLPHVAVPAGTARELGTIDP